MIHLLRPHTVVPAFDRWLANRGLQFEATVIGGAALALLGVIERATQDVDVLSPPLPPQIAEAAHNFAEHMRTRDINLADDWLNNGPALLVHELPLGWRSRRQPLFTGTALTLGTLGRSDLLKLKLFALCDRGTDLGDCIALRPTKAELERAQRWVAHRDANPHWPQHVRATLEHLRERVDGLST